MTGVIYVRFQNWPSVCSGTIHPSISWDSKGLGANNCNFREITLCYLNNWNLLLTSDTSPFRISYTTPPGVCLVRRDPKHEFLLLEV